ncbi:MAG: hypothetical protein M1840_004260 [Geoglossum simile]|nr:MAG: hypothetical protein M1840_004260 [Geoglossum simile]
MDNACSPIRTGLEWADDLPSTHPDDYRLFSCPMEGDNEISVDNLPPLYRTLDDQTVGKVLDLPGLKFYQRLTYWPRDFTKNGELKPGRRSLGHAYTGTGRNRDKLKGGKFGIQPPSDTAYIPFSGGKPMAEYFDVDNLRRKVAAQETEIAQLHSTIAEKEVSITGQEERILRVTALHTAADEKVGAQREELNALQIEMEALREEIGVLRADNTSLRENRRAVDNFLQTGMKILRISGGD